jgi:16S rRNA (uracil1498-N3)-methyltransferase
MSDHRFYAGEDALPGLRPGDRVCVFAAGHEFVCEFIDAGRQAQVRLLDELPPLPAQRRLVLYQALIRPNRFEWLIEKATEVGVERIVPLVSAHSAVRPEEIGAGRIERWRRIGVEASEQCGRRTVPAIATPLPFSAALSSACGRRVLAWEGLRGESVAATLPAAGEEPVALFVGPEGGWSEPEVEAARAAGAELLGLGANVLRAETAAVVGSALLLLS